MCVPHNAPAVDWHKVPRRPVASPPAFLPFPATAVCASFFLTLSHSFLDSRLRTFFWPFRQPYLFSQSFLTLFHSFSRFPWQPLMCLPLAISFGPFLVAHPPSWEMAACMPSLPLAALLPFPFRRSLSTAFQPFLMRSHSFSSFPMLSAGRL